MPEITINTGRVDWPCYRSFDCKAEELVLWRFMELNRTCERALMLAILP
jgi:hypothetical protein